MISEAQRLQFALMKKASFNNFDGEKVVADLEAHEDLWTAAMMSRETEPFFPLRDLREDHWNVDTLMILSSGKDDGCLESLAESWDADDVSWLDDDETSDTLGTSRPTGRILMIWWD